MTDNARDTETDTLIQAITNAGLDELLNHDDNDLENLVDPPSNMDEIPYLVNRHVIALTLGSQTNNMKSLILGFDLLTSTPCAIFSDHQGVNFHRMRVSIDEMFLLMKQNIFDKIQNLFASKEPVPSFHLGGIEVSLYTSRQGVKSVKFQRMGHPFINFFCAPTTWKKFGQARYLIKMSINLLTQSGPYIVQFSEQFVKESVAHLQSQGIDFDTLSKLDIHKQIAILKTAMGHTNPFLTVAYAQDLSMMESCHLPSVKEEFTTFHFSYFQEKVMSALQNQITTDL